MRRRRPLSPSSKSRRRHASRPGRVSFPRGAGSSSPSRASEPCRQARRRCRRCRLAGKRACPRACGQRARATFGARSGQRARTRARCFARSSGQASPLSAGISCHLYSQRVLPIDVWGPPVRPASQWRRDTSPQASLAPFTALLCCSLHSLRRNLHFPLQPSLLTGAGIGRTRRGWDQNQSGAPTSFAFSAPSKPKKRRKMTGDGSSTGDGPLEGRMNLLRSKVDSKIFFHKDAMVEYVEMKHLIGDIAEEKARVEQEALRRAAAAPPELLGPGLMQLEAAREELAATKKVLAARDEELAAVKEELAVAKKERDEKDEELKATIAKVQEFEALKDQYEQQSESVVELDSVQDQPSKSLSDHCATIDDELEGLRETLIKEFMQIDCGGRVLGVKEMGRLDEKPFHDACAAKLPPKEAKREASKLYTTWEKLLKNPSWKPFKTDAVGGNSQEEDIDVDDDMLQELKRAWGEGTHNAVVRALMEMREYNRLNSRSTTYELWNYKAGRKATTLECVDYMSKQVKQLSMSKRRKTRRSAGTA